MRKTQRQIREQMTQTYPRQPAPSLDGYVVETISKQDATPVILHYEWLRTVGQSTYFIGLISPTRELHGVACFGWGPTGPIRQLIGEPAFCLERGACVHYAPANAASFLITHACKLMHRITGAPLFFAYADPQAGEYGGVYQAANWVYLGQGLNGAKGRKRRVFVLPPGADPNDPHAWQTTRILRRQKPRLTMRTAPLVGWLVQTKPAKHVYAIHVGRGRQKWRKAMIKLPYPAPEPERKRANLPEKIFRVSSPVPAQGDLFKRPAIALELD